ncbi:MAG: hypothetical protein COY80_01520 [Candidatus Pacebacteria bacterium CG_4_10_14_0_8_um_filter_42_14]|nr:MAG: hypothetical protein COY80_01520 [Candidatus Pacebacteria bacterium CG_4_10_14_0_8_um_filter_42_14]
MGDIKFVYFDVGGVLLKDYSGSNKWVEMRRDLGVTEDLDKKFEFVWNKYRSKICIDRDVDTLIPEFEEATGLSFPENHSILADFVNRFELNLSIWPIVKQIANKYKVGLLTNMYPRMLSLIQEKKLVPDLAWDVVVDSSLVGYQKPETEIFLLAEKLAKVEPNQIFFVENSKEHTEAAEKRGWKTLLYDPKDPQTSNSALLELLGT